MPEEFPTPFDGVIANPTRHPERADLLPPPIPDAEAVLATETFQVSVDGVYETVRKGQRFNRDDPIVKRAPECFATAPVPLTKA